MHTHPTINATKNIEKSFFAAIFAFHYL